ncbi:unnamed protein product [Paramecium sonneborni]|uniref:Uncharacterized protein n=1 Tax=Paramecium sonneborni TaxID=65129 RepID=A0A8S1QVN4_9CILI|nr:unnamed protein product [Paramecium sonneborni]
MDFQKNKLGTLQKKSPQVEAFVSFIDKNCSLVIIAEPIFIPKQSYQIDKVFYLANIIHEKLNFVIYYKEKDDLSYYDEPKVGLFINKFQEQAEMRIDNFCKQFQSQEGFYLKSTIANFEKIYDTLSRATLVIQNFQKILEKNYDNEEAYVSIYDETIDWIKNLAI